MGDGKERLNMDYNLDIILHEPYMRILGLRKKTVWWGGEIHECVPRQFFTENNIFFIEASKGAIYDILMKNTDISEPVVLSIDRRKHNIEEIIRNMNISSLLRKITKTKFDLYFWKEDESIDTEYELTQNMDLCELLLNALESNANIRVRNTQPKMI